jgi:hypothetical protein
MASDGEEAHHQPLPAACWLKQRVRQAGGTGVNAASLRLAAPPRFLPLLNDDPSAGLVEIESHAALIGSDVGKINAELGLRTRQLPQLHWDLGKIFVPVVFPMAQRQCSRHTPS